MGNIGQTLNVANPTEPVSVQYEPYGRPLDDNNPWPVSNGFGFSSKWLEGENWINYYGYRYYSPRLGRWLSRDTIEWGRSFNPFEFNRNATPNWFDPDGQDPRSSQPTSRPDVNNFDPGTVLGAALSPLIGKTTCGIFIVRTLNSEGIGHTSIVWDSGSVGYVTGDSARSDQEELSRDIETKKRAFSVYRIDYYPDERFPRFVAPLRYGSGFCKGRECPDKPDCKAIITKCTKH